MNRSVASDQSTRRLPLIHFFADSVVWIVTFPIAMWLRYDYDFGRIQWSLIPAVFGAVVLQGEFGLFFGQYRRKWRYGSFDEIRGVALTALAVGVVLSALLWIDTATPRSVPALACGLALLGHVSLRSLWRLYQESLNRPGDDAKRLLIVGGGNAAAQILRTLRDSPTQLLPVAIVDDDPKKRNLEISGVPVAGRLARLTAVAERYNASTVLIAIPSANSTLLRVITRTAESAGLEVLVLPPVEQLFGGIQATDIRPVRHEDLLGRRQAEIDTAAIADYIDGRRVLVTGAGGSIGSEICRQLAKFEPAELLMLDRDESGLHGTQLSIRGRALLEDRALILADIRDAARVDELFEQYRPEVVFHTAALKHLPLLEMYPAEGWKTNVVGTLNLLEAAAKHGVDKFVNVSTDKAAAPTSVLGWTKRIGERLTAWANGLGSTEFVSVRFGNVLGSNGSVLKSFEAQAAAGNAITVTHPDITRYFMTIEEASRLTIHAGAIGDPGEIMILDMGEPVKILDVATRFAERNDPPLDIVFTGLRKNEKLHEDLVAGDEVGTVKSHQLITHVVAPPLHPTPTMREATAPGVDGMVSIALSDPASSIPSTDTSDSLRATP